MGHKTLIDGTAYSLSGGKTLIDGTAYDIFFGKSLINGTARETCFYEPLIITTASFPRGQAEKEYSAKVDASGGSGGYIFSIAPGSALHRGLSMAPDGTISGIPQSSGGYKTTFQVQDSRGHTAVKTINMSVRGREIRFTFGTRSFKYDGLPHTVSVTHNRPEVTENDYTVLYGGIEGGRTEVGAYDITIRMKIGGYTVVKDPAGAALTIYR